MEQTSELHLWLPPGLMSFLTSLRTDKTACANAQIDALVGERFGFQKQEVTAICRPGSSNASSANVVQYVTCDQCVVQFVEVQKSECILCILDLRCFRHCLQTALEYELVL